LSPLSTTVNIRGLRTYTTEVPRTPCGTFITSFDAGVPLRDVQEAAPHADPRPTVRYDRAVAHGTESDTAYLGHVGVDGLLAGRGGYGYPVVAVTDEVEAVDPVDLDRRNCGAAPLGQRQLLPAGPDPVGGWPEVPVEVTTGVDRADNGVQSYRLQS
jgi:hypothetical protein